MRAMAQRSERSLSPRLRRTIELIYGVEGVAAARVWYSPGSINVGISPARTAAPADVLRRVECAVAGLRDDEETWDFGLLQL